MSAVAIVPVVLLCGTIALLVWGPRLTSLGIETKPEHPEERRPGTDETTK